MFCFDNNNVQKLETFKSFFPKGMKYQSFTLLLKFYNKKITHGTNYLKKEYLIKKMSEEQYLSLYYNILPLGI